MADGLRLLAPLLLAAYLGVTFVWRSYRVWRRTGVNPYVLSLEDDLEGVIARFFRLCVLLLVPGAHSMICAHCCKTTSAEGCADVTAAAI